MTEKPFNFFVLTDLPGRKVLHVNVSARLQQTLSDEFRKQYFDFLSDREEIDYQPAYHPTDEEIFRIRPFDDINDLLSITNSASSIESLDPDPEVFEHIKAFFSTADNKNELIFQNFDRRRIISNRGLAIIWSKDTYRKMEEPGLNLNKSLGAVLRSEDLLFHSSWCANRIFDLSPYLKKATDEQVKQFLSNTRFAQEYTQNKLAEFDDSMRTKVCLILESGVLDVNTPQGMQIIASDLQYDLKIDSNGNIMVPNGRKEIRRLLQFLAEDFMLSPLTDRLHFITSKRPIASKVSL